jgi:hypothetical protein
MVRDDHADVGAMVTRILIGWMFTSILFAPMIGAAMKPRLRLAYAPVRRPR